MRHVLLTFFLILAALGLFAVAVTWFAWSQNLIEPFQLRGIKTALWWSFFGPAMKNDNLWAMSTISAYVLLAFLSEIILRRYFGRSPSPEIFFMRLFLLSLPFQAVRLIILLVLGGQIPVFFGLFATRIAWFGRFVGISLLLCISLFLTEMPLRRSGSLLVMAVLASLAITVMVPLDITQPLGNLLYRSGVDTQLALTIISLEILSVISLAGIAKIQQNNHYYMLAFFLLLTVVGVELSFFFSSALAITGITLIFPGVIGFAYEVRKIYQWI